MTGNCDIKTNLLLIACEASELLASQFVNHFVFCISYLSLGKNKLGLQFHIDFFPPFKVKSAATRNGKILQVILRIASLSSKPMVTDKIDKENQPLPLLCEKTLDQSVIGMCFKTSLYFWLQLN